MSKKKNNLGGLVYSTNPELNNETEENQEDITLPKEQQKLRVLLETKHRAGKIVTIVYGFIGAKAAMELLGKELKTKCGAGGSVKDGEIIIQGNYKDKVLNWLKDWGYRQTK